jgi:hypothetical protein
LVSDIKGKLYTKGENRVLRRIFGPKRVETLGVWRKLRNEELHNLYYSPNTIRMTKSKKVRCAGHVESMGRNSLQPPAHAGSSLADFSTL